MRFFLRPKSKAWHDSSCRLGTVGNCPRLTSSRARISSLQEFLPEGGLGYMARKIAYWATTGFLAAMTFLAAYAYLLGGPQSAQGFSRVGYPQQLRIILGIAKPLGGIALLVPGFAKLKEWAYAGFTFAWISAFFAHYLAGERQVAFMPLILL